MRHYAPIKKKVALCIVTGNSFQDTLLRVEWGKVDTEMVVHIIQ